MTEAISGSMEDYLETIFHIIQEHQVARPKDIGKALGVTGPSVTKALRWLAERGLIHYAPFELVTLTAAGEQIARQVARKHEALRDFLVRVLVVDEAEAEEAACKMEHALSPNVLERFVQYADFVATCPRGGKQWFKGDGSARCLEGRPLDDCEACLTTCLGGVQKKKRVKKAGGAQSVALKDMAAGTQGRIVRLGKSVAGRRLTEAGVGSGAVVEVEQVDAHQDQVRIKVRGHHLQFRTEEAAHIHLEPL